MSTVGPAALDATATRLEGTGVRIVDAPVSGGAARAADGDLLVMVGGAESDVAASRPVLDALASSAPVVGPRPGDGQRFKIVNQLLCGVHIAAAGEALALADSMGLDLRQVHEVLGTGAAASFMFGDRGARMVDGAFDDVRSALTIFVKDMGLVAEAAAQVEQEVPLAASAQQLYQRGSALGWDRRDDSIVYEVLRERWREDTRSPHARLEGEPHRHERPSTWDSRSDPRLAGDAPLGILSTGACTRARLGRAHRRARRGPRRRRLVRPQPLRRVITRSASRLPGGRAPPRSTATRPTTTSDRGTPPTSTPPPADLFRRAGADYVVLTTKHHDGVTLWDAPGTGDRNTVHRGPQRDLVGEIATAVTEAGMRFGVYYSGGLDWHVRPTEPLVSGEDVHDLKRPRDDEYGKYCASHVRDLIDRYSPDVFWNDIGWPDENFHFEEGGLGQLLEHFYTARPEGLINDRFAGAHQDFVTTEYQAGEIPEGLPWENCRGVGLSFGYNQVEDDAQYMTGAQGAPRRRRGLQGRAG